jgi:hypothetical protein
MSEKVKVIVLASSVMIVGIIVNAYFRYLKRLPQDYTIGTVVKVMKPANGNDVVQFEYFLNEKRYTGIVDLEGRRDIVGKRFIVSYPENQPSIGFMLLNHPVSDSSLNFGKSWKEFPLEYN